MPNSINLYLPLNTFISVRSFTNAYFKQRITITPETGSPVVAIGTGERDTPIAAGTYSFTTPGSSTNPLGYKVTVNMDYSVDGGTTWQPTNVSSGSCSVMYYNLAMVVGEDYIDNDWNDAVIQFTWWLSPNLR